MICFFLHIYGDKIEDKLRHTLLLVYQLLCAIAAGVFQVASDPFSNTPVVEVSVALARVMEGYLRPHPKANVDLSIIFRIFSLQAWPRPRT